MTISFTGDESLYGRIGKIGKVLDKIRTWQNTTITSPVNEVMAMFDTEYDLVSGVIAAQDTERTAGVTFGTSLQTLALNTINRMVWRDNPQYTRTDASVSITELIRQMKADSKTVKTCTIGTSTATGAANVGNGTLVISTKRGDGLVNENIFAETANLTCTADGSAAGGGVQFNETFTFYGDAAIANPLSWEWPGGSGSQTTVKVVNTAQDATTGVGNNHLKNSEMENWTANVPDNWSLLFGTAGVDIFRDNTVAYTGSYSCKIVGGGANVSIAQQFDSAQNAAKLKTEVPYAVIIRAKVDVVPAAGVVTVDLIKQDGTTVWADSQSVANSFTVNCPSLTTNWQTFSGVFRMPNALFDAFTTYRIRVRISTGLSAGTNLYLEDVAMTEMYETYASGLYVALFTGSLAFYKNDTFTITTTNDRGGATNLNTFQTLCDRLWDMRGKRLLLPSNGAPNIADTLITA